LTAARVFGLEPEACLNQYLPTETFAVKLFSKVMTVTLLKSKLHKAAVTDASVDYEGSLTIAEDLAKLVGFRPYEKILVGNMGNGNRFETYVIYGPAGSGAIELNGATAHLGKIGDRLTIMSFTNVDLADSDAHEPRVALLDESNNPLRVTGRQV
jgi:aspartate 1-decarboxylase